MAVWPGMVSMPGAHKQQPEDRYMKTPVSPFAARPCLVVASFAKRSLAPRSLAPRSLALTSLIIWCLAGPAMAKPLYPNSVVSNDHEFIATSDDSVFACMTFDGRRTAEMPDKRKDGLMAKNTFIFSARGADMHPRNR